MLKKQLTFVALAAMVIVAATAETASKLDDVFEAYEIIRIARQL